MQFGYDNGSKFAKTFCGIIGVMPNDCRAAGAKLACESVICCEAPDDVALGE